MNQLGDVTGKCFQCSQHVLAAVSDFVTNPQPGLCDSTGLQARGEGYRFTFLVLLEIKKKCMILEHHFNHSSEMIKVQMEHSSCTTTIINTGSNAVSRTDNGTRFRGNGLPHLWYDKLKHLPLCF